ncbi:MAG: methyl-accepting chemotaxis protein [Alphaproteobacteria bacterium]
MKLSRQIVAMTVCVLLTAVVAVSALSAYGAFEILRYQAQAELQSLGEAKKTAFIRYHQRLLKEVAALANTVLATEAVLEFDVASASLDDTDRLAWQSAYAADGFFLAGEGDGGEEAPSLAGYGRVHSRYHRSLLEVQQSQDLGDLILLNGDGLVVYSTAKRADFGASINSASLHDSVVAKAYRRFVSVGETSKAAFFDYQRYRGAGDAVVGFVAAPVMIDDSPRGVLLFQLRADVLDGLMTPPEGRFETGEIIVVGDDFMVRNDTAFTRDAPLNRRLDNAPVRLALSGKSGFVTTESSTGYHLAYATPIDLDGQSFALVVSQPVKALLTPFKDTGVEIGIGLVATLLVLIWVSVIAGRRLALPVSQIAEKQKQLAAGDTGVSVPDIISPKEVADLGEAMYVFTKNARRVERYRDSEEKKETEEKPDTGLANQVESSLSSTLETFADGIPLFTRQKTALRDATAGLGERSRSVRDDAKQISADTDALAVSAERVSSAIDDVVEKVDNTSSLSASIARQAIDVSTKLTDLAGAGNRLDSLADSISQIAGRTNLVSLNASLEASRADANGNGFSMIAAEIKSIAGQVQQASEDTRQRHADLRADLDATLVAARMISDTAGNTNDTVRSLENAVALQAVSAGDIARSTRNVASKIESIAEKLNSLAESAAASEQASGDISASADALVQNGTYLVNEVSKMLADMKYPSARPKSEP